MIPDGLVFFFVSRLFLSQKHLLLFVPHVGQRVPQVLQRQSRRIIAGDDGVDDLRRELAEPDDVGHIALVAAELVRQCLRARHDSLVDEPLPRPPPGKRHEHRLAHRVAFKPILAGDDYLLLPAAPAHDILDGDLQIAVRQHFNLFRLHSIPPAPSARNPRC